MAHLVKLDVDCQQCRTRRATYVLRTNRNEIVGHFCERCGVMACARQQADEDRAAMGRGEPPAEARQ